MLLLLFVAAVSASCSSGYTGSSCQYHCQDLCRTHTTCAADRCDVPICQCSGYGSTDTATGMCVCDTGRAGNQCEFAISETDCSQSQPVGRYAQPSGTSTCPASPTPAVPVCSNSSMTYTSSVRGPFEWQTYPCFPPVSTSFFLWPYSTVSAYLSMGPRDEFSYVLFTEFSGSLPEHAYGFTLVPFTWSSVLSERVYTIHSTYEPSRTVEADAAGPDANGRIRVYLSATRLANPSTWYACTQGLCAIQSTRFPGYGLTVNATTTPASTRTVYLSNATSLWSIAVNLQLANIVNQQAINSTSMSNTITGVDSLVDCIGHLFRDYTKRVATWHQDLSTCTMSTNQAAPLVADLSAQTWIGPVNTAGLGGGAFCSSRFYSFPTESTSPDTICTKKFIGPTRLVYGGVFGSTAAVLMLSADIVSGVVRVRNTTDAPGVNDYFYWNLTDYTGNGREFTISVAYMPADAATPLCLALDASNNVGLDACNPLNQRIFWFMDRSTTEYMQGFNLRPSVFSESAGVALEVQTDGVNVRVVSGYPARVFSAPAARWTPWFKGVPYLLAGQIDGFQGLSYTSSNGGLFEVPTVTLAAGTFDRAHCISICAVRQPQCVAAEIDTDGRCKLFQFADDNAVVGTQGILDTEHAIFTTASGSDNWYIFNAEPFKSLTQNTFPATLNAHCAYQLGFFAVKGGGGIGNSAFGETKYRNGYYCVNSLDVGPALLANVGFDDEAVGAMMRSNSKKIIIDTVISTAAADIADVMFLVFHATGEPFIYTIHNAMAEEMTLEADLSPTATDPGRVVKFSGVSKGGPMQWKLSSLNIGAATTFTIEAYDLPGWFLQLDAPLGTPPAGLVLKRTKGRGYDKWFVQYGFPFSGLLGYLGPGLDLGPGVRLDKPSCINRCLTAPDNSGADNTACHRCFFDIPTPAACLSVCAYQQDCKAINWWATADTGLGIPAHACMTLTEAAIDGAPVAAAVSDSHVISARHGNGWYESRCLVDTYQRIITTGVGLTANSAETWLRTYYSESRCRRHVLGPYLLYERTGNPIKVGARYNVGDFGTADATKHYELINCSDSTIPFDWTSGCEDGLTVNPRSLFALEQVAYDQYYIRHYWKTYHQLETQAYDRYLVVIPGSGAVRTTDYRGYRPAMFTGFRKIVHDGQFNLQTLMGTASSAAVPVYYGGDVSVSLTLDSSTRKLVVDFTATGKKQTWGLVTPGLMRIRWRYTHGILPPAYNIGTLSGVAEGGQCMLLCWANKRCAEAMYDAATLTCVLNREGSIDATFTGNPGLTLYGKPTLAEPTGVVTSANDFGFTFTGLTLRVMFGYTMSVGTPCSGCLVTADVPFMAGEADNGIQPLIVRTNLPTDSSRVDYVWSFASGRNGDTPTRSDVIVIIDRPSSAREARSDNLCLADPSHTSGSSPNWCCTSPASSFFRYTIEDQTGCILPNFNDLIMNGAGFTMIKLPPTYPVGYPQTAGHPAQPTAWFTSRSHRVVLTVYPVRGDKNTAQAHIDEFLCGSYSDGFYFSPDQYDKDCVFHVFHECELGQVVPSCPPLPF